MESGDPRFRFFSGDVKQRPGRAQPPLRIRLVDGAGEAEDPCRIHEWRRTVELEIYAAVVASGKIPKYAERRAVHKRVLSHLIEESPVARCMFEQPLPELVRERMVAV